MNDVVNVVQYGANGRLLTVFTIFYYWTGQICRKERT